jgi:hypothetical protein
MAFRRRRGKKWLVSWTSPVTGVERSRGGFPTAAQADAFKVEVEGLVARGLDWEPPRATEEATLVSAMHAYLDHVEMTKAAGTARNRTISLELFRRFIEETTPSTAPLTLAVLTKQALTRFLAWLRTPESSRRGGRSEDAIRKAVEHVQLFWAWAGDDDDHEAVTPRPRKLAELSGIRSPRTPTRAPTWADMDAAIAALAVPDERLRNRGIAYHVLVATLERCTGLRVSQVDRLQVGDVELATGVLTFRGELGKSQQERAGRLLPIAPVLLPVLSRLVAGRAAGELLVPRQHEASEQAKRRRLCQAWSAAGVPEAVWAQRPNHAFRKGFSTELARAGVVAEVRDFLTGHSAGIAGFYTDPSALPLMQAVAHVAPFAPAAAEAIEQALSSTSASPETGRTQGGP